MISVQMVDIAYTATQQVYEYSFYPRTIQDWNWLPAATTDSPTLEEFPAAMQHNIDNIMW